MLEVSEDEDVPELVEVADDDDEDEDEETELCM
jgi:hypothetical protein